MSVPKKPRPVPAVKKPAPAAPAARNFDLEAVKSLITLVAQEKLHEFEFESGDLRFRIRMNGDVPAPVLAIPAPASVAAAPILPVAPSPAAAAAPAAPATPAEAPASDAGIHYVTSPIVGTFYRAPNPNAAPFVQAGDFVKPGQTLCVVEAMKLMNEIECDIAGEVVKVLVENGQPVEYGERLFAVRIG